MKKLLFGLLAAAGCATAVAASGAYAAHEWGTFTSVQGQDGVQLEWNPYAPADLPKFVYDRARPEDHKKPNMELLLGKGIYVARQRMETPVIYFYSPEKKTVDVRVDFPSGLMTEWYPRATSSDAQVKGAKNSYLEWKGVEINPSAAGELPVEPGKSHYYAARETEAALLKVLNPAKSATEVERFLFYRGVGHFEAPLKVTTAKDDGSLVVLQNTGKEELRHLYVLRVENGKGGKTYTLQHVPKLGKSLFERIDLAKAKATTRDELKKALEKSLAKEGLYGAEAAAMVKTWEDSWLDEPGLRVLYVLSNDWTCRVLPLKITPEPQETVRVMVGRAEIITPKVEIALEQHVREYQSGDAAVREMAIVKTRALALGRFQDVAVRRVIKKNPGEPFKNAAFQLASQAAKDPATSPLALK